MRYAIGLELSAVTSYVMHPCIITFSALKEGSVCDIKCRSHWDVKLLFVFYTTLQNFISGIWILFAAYNTHFVCYFMHGFSWQKFLGFQRVNVYDVLVFQKIPLPLPQLSATTFCCHVSILHLSKSWFAYWQLQKQIWRFSDQSWHSSVKCWCLTFHLTRLWSMLE